MTPILGIMASSVTASTLSSFESIATVSVTTATQASVEFTSIPSTYTHLHIRGISRNANADTFDDSTKIQINGDTGSNYSYHVLYGNNTAAASINGINQANIITFGTPGGNSVAFAGCVMDILDYTNTNKYKTVRGLNGFNQNTSTSSIDLFSGLWRSTNAITSIKIFPNTGNWKQYTTFALYGIRG